MQSLNATAPKDREVIEWGESEHRRRKTGRRAQSKGSSPEMTTTERLHQQPWHKSRGTAPLKTDASKLGDRLPAAAGSGKQRAGKAVSKVSLMPRPSQRIVSGGL